MNDFGQLISNNILELALLKKKSLNPRYVLSSGLLCDSKRVILDTYLTTIGNSIVMCGSICQLLPEFKTVDDINTRILHAKTVFKRSYMNDLVNQILKVEHCSGCPKDTMLFGILQGQLEDVMFEDIKNKLIEYIGCCEESIFSLCEELLDMIYDFAEAAIFHLSGLRINCKNISDSIFKDDRFKISTIGLKFSSCEIDPAFDMPPASCIFKEPHKKECLHLFLCSEFFRVKNWMNVYIDLYKTYHNNPKKITLILDYTLIEDDTIFTEEDYKTYLHAQSVFGKAFIINCEHIIFNSYEEAVDITSIDTIEECLI